MEDKLKEVNRLQSRIESEIVHSKRFYDHRFLFSISKDKEMFSSKEYKDRIKEAADSEDLEPLIYLIKSKDLADSEHNKCLCSLYLESLIIDCGMEEDRIDEYILGLKRICYRLFPEYEENPDEVTVVEKEDTTRNKKAQYKALLLDKRWIEKRDSILRRDNFSCRICSSSMDLNVHHSKYSEGKRPWEYDDIDLITLCSRCHRKHHDIKS